MINYLGIQHIDNYVGAYYYGLLDDELTLIVSKALPLIIARELTDIKAKYLKAYYEECLSQKDIASMYGVTQPTVSRQINQAKFICNNYLKYIIYTFYAVKESEEYKK